MPKKQKKEPNKLKFGEPLTWVINNLTKKELEALDANETNMNSVFSEIGRMVELGWSFSAKWSYSDECFQVIAIQQYVDNPNPGYALSGRSDDLLDCYRIIWFKYAVIAGGELSEFSIDSEGFTRG